MNVRNVKDMKLTRISDNAFDPSKFQPVSMVDLHKPVNGLWLSPTDSDYGWADWCKREDYYTGDRVEEFLYTGKTAVIDCDDDYESFAWRYPRNDGSSYIDYVSMSEHFDAVHLTSNGLKEMRWENSDIYLWDCETVLIFNISTITLNAK